MPPSTNCRSPTLIFQLKIQDRWFLQLTGGGAAIEVRLTPHRGYESRIRDLHKASGVVPTALLAFQSSSLEIGAVDDFIMDLCNGFSVAQGRKVNWIQHARYLKPRIFQQSIFGRNITKAYATSPLCFIPGSRTPLALALTDSISVVSAIAQFRKKFDPHSILVNAWLDARTETDYLEGRTLKYVVVLEALNALTTSVDKAIASKPVDTGSWRLLYKTNSSVDANDDPRRTAHARKVAATEFIDFPRYPFESL
jgi:hypothetical protein